MKVESLSSTRDALLVEGPLLIKPRVFSDDRGFFFESWNKQAFQVALVEAGYSAEEAIAIEFFQDNHSRSSRGVLRGLHYQVEPEPQGKLVRCSIGAIFDVAVDLRMSSTTFGHWVAAELSAENQQQLWLPVGFAHGFLALSDTVEVQYKASGFWNKSCERSLRWDDPQLGIAWPLDRVGMQKPLLAEKDAAAPVLSIAESAGDLFS